jgi:hypothetical protein
MSTAIARTMIAADSTLAQIEDASDRVETLLALLAQQQQRITELEVEVSLVEADRDTALEIILWPFLCQHSTPDEGLEFLRAHGLDPRDPAHAGEIAAFLEREREFDVDDAVMELMQDS